MAGIGLAKKGLGLLGKKKRLHKHRAFTEDQLKLKKHLDKKKNKPLDWGDVQKSYKIFTRK
jgi:hypothetical protein